MEEEDYVEISLIQVILYLIYYLHFRESFQKIVIFQSIFYFLKLKLFFSIIYSLSVSHYELNPSVLK